MFIAPFEYKYRIVYHGYLDILEFCTNGLQCAPDMRRHDTYCDMLDPLPSNICINMRQYNSSVHVSPAMTEHAMKETFSVPSMLGLYNED